MAIEPEAKSWTWVNERPCAAELARQPIARPHHSFRQVDGGHDLTGLAVATLRDVLLHPGTLHGVPAVSGKALDSDYLAPVDTPGRNHAGTPGLAIHVHGTGTALADTTAELGAGQPQVVA